MTIASSRSRFATLPSINNDQTSVTEVTEQITMTPSPADLYATPRPVSDPNECFFYHTMDLPGYGSVAGYWDLRGNESQYLGNVALAGKRVLEIGPASGHLSFFMERAGAEVVSLEAGEDYSWELCWDMPDQVPAELPNELASHRDMMRRLRNSYWLAHDAFASKTKVHYGSAYAIPATLARFDVSLIGCVLLHNQHPLKILEQCARLTKETVVVVEVFREKQLAQVPVQLAQSPGVYQPGAHNRVWHTWWSFSPVYFVDILRSMGFTESRVTFHKQICHGAPTDLFTVVASRPSPQDVSRNEAKVDVELNSNVDSLRAKTGQLMRVPVSIFNCGEAPLSSSTDQPVLVSYHWRDESGETIDWDGLRTYLPRTLHRGDHEDLVMTVRAPDGAGSYWLEVSILKEHVTWYDDLIGGLPLRIKTKVEV